MIQAAIAYIDLLIIATMCFFMYKGYKNGFLPEVTRAMGIILGLVLATRFMSNLSLFLFGAVKTSPVLIAIVSFIAIFTASVLGFKYLSTKFITAVKFSMTLGELDRFAGIALGFVKGAVVVSLCTALLSLATFSSFIRNDIRQSELFNPMRRVLPLVYSVAKLFIPDSYKPFYQELDESFSGYTAESRGEADDLLDFYRPK
jgi:membrane protein required for colicin V production